MKNVIYVSFLISLTLSFLSCTEDLQSITPQNSFHYFALFRIFPDVYQEQMFDLIKNNRVKTISIVAKDLTNEKIDSLTYLAFNNNGKLIRRTTTECTTLGCLPYTNRQEYSYKNGRLDRINQFTFVDNSKSMLYYWNLADTTKMNLFDWEEYSFDGDTVFSESAIARWTFVKDSNDNLVYRKLMVKSTKQTIENDFIYSDSTIRISSKSKFPAEDNQKIISVSDDGIKIYDFENDNMNLVQHWHINSEGLPYAINTFYKGKPKRGITINYEFY